jgi:small redox-active disulfide protein 2
MKAVKVLGTGCANCRSTIQRVEAVAKELGVPITLEKVESIQDIAACGILATPGVMVDGRIVHSGGVPTREKIASWLGADSAGEARAVPVISGCGCSGRG